MTISDRVPKEGNPAGVSDLDRPTVGDPADDELANLARALGHPIRVKILRLLDDREEWFCGELVAELPVAQSTVSQHLKQLKAAGWVRSRVDGPRVRYRRASRARSRLMVLLGDL